MPHMISLAVEHAAFSSVKKTGMTLVGLEPTTFESLLIRATRSPMRYPLRHRVLQVVV